MTLRPQYSQQAFDGADYVPSRDDRRLLTQIDRIRNLMMDGKWRTYEDIAAVTGDPAPSISAQLRNLRKSEHGGYTVERKYKGDGLYIFRLDPQSGERQLALQYKGNLVASLIDTVEKAGG